MFIPIFIAILLGLVNPSNTSSNCTQNGGTTVSTNTSTPGEPGNPGDPGDTGDTDPGEDGTGGNTGQNPPR